MRGGVAVEAWNAALTGFVWGIIFIMSLSGSGLEPSRYRSLLMGLNAVRNDGTAVSFHAATKLQKCGKRARRSIMSFREQAEHVGLIDAIWTTFSIDTR